MEYVLSGALVPKTRTYGKAASVTMHLHVWSRDVTCHMAKRNEIRTSKKN